MHENEQQKNDPPIENQASLAADALSQTLIQTAVAVIVIMAPDGTILEFNPEAERLWGCRREKVLGKHCPSLFLSSTENDRFVEHIGRVLAGEPARNFEGWVQAVDGDRVISWNLNRTLDETGNPSAVVAIGIDITQRKHAEKALKVSNERLGMLIEASPLAIIGVDLEGRVIGWNSAATELFGWTAEDVMGLPNPIIPEDQQAEYEEHKAAAFQGRSLSGRDVERLHKNGKLISVHIVVAPIIDHVGNVVGGMALAKDISAPKTYEEELQRSISLHEATLESTADGILVVDNQGSIVSYNRNFMEMWNIPEDLVLTRQDDTLIDFVLGQLSDPGEFLAKVRHLYADPDGDSFDVLNFVDGRVFERYSKPQRLGSKSVGRVWSFRDVTTRWRAEAAAKEAESIRVLLDSTFEGLLLLDEGIIVDLNEAAASIIGRTKQELIGTTIHSYFTAEHSEVITEHLSSDSDTSYEVDLIRPDVERRRIQIASRPVPYKGYRVRITTIRDVTDFKHALEAAVESEQHYRSLLEQASDGIALISPSGDVLMANPRLLEMFDYDFDELCRSTGNLIAPERAEDASAAFSQVFDGGTVVLETTLIRRDGSAFPAEASMKQLSDGRIQVFLRDVTERKRLQQESLKAQKLESIGLLAGGIAHDFGNILSILLGNIDIAKSLADGNDKLKERLDKAIQAIHRANGLTQQLLVFSRGNPRSREISGLIGIMHETASMILRESNIHFDLRVEEGLWPVEADIAQLGQVMTNLMINAKHAMPDGGLVDIAARNSRIADDSSLPVEAGPFVKITIKDQGAGIPEHFLEKIFDPYFTTKPQGSGLGLAICYSIVRDHGGCITVDSTPGEGSAFTVYLPATPSHPAERRAGGKAGNKKNRNGSGRSLKDPVVGGSRRILVMDDEEMIREIAVEMLVKLGFEVEAVSCGEEAVSACGRASDTGTPFELAILDMTVPGRMGGEQALKLLKAVHPELRIVAASGYFNEPGSLELEGLGLCDTLRKPYDMETLRRLVTENDGG